MLEGQKENLKWCGEMPGFTLNKPWSTQGCTGMYRGYSYSTLFGVPPAFTPHEALFKYTECHLQVHFMINSGTNPLVGRPNASPISCGGFLMAKWTESNPEETFYRSKLIDAVLLLKSLKYLKQLFIYQNQLGDMSLFTFRGVTVYACTWNRCNTWNICEQKNKN